ncbi:MAG: ABC transporter substrate-binding protein [Anaerocolumna sp.]
MKNKVLAILLILCMLIMGMTGCSSKSKESANNDTNATNSDTSSSTGSNTASNEEPYNAVLVYLVASDSQDSDKVSEKFNELTKKDLNMNVKLMPMTWSTWNTQMQLMLAGGEQVDLFPLLMSNATTYIASSYIDNIAPYIESADYLMDSVGKDDIWCCSIGDFLWGVPTMKERANPVAMITRTDCLEAAGIDASQVKSYEDMAGVYAKVQAKYPDMIMFGGTSTSAPASQTNELDTLGNRFGVLEDFGQTTKVTNYFESDQYKRLVNLARQWYETGYTSKDMATCSDSGETLMKAGNLFSYACYYKPNTKQEKDDQTGYDTTIIPIETNELTTWGTGSLGYSVGSSSPNPAKAVELLDWISRTEEANDLLNWGIEGVHWALQDDGTINYPEGVTSESCGYHQNFGFALPNQFNSHVWAGNDVKVWDQYQDFRNNAQISKAYGFSPDLSEYVDQIAALTDVYNQYDAMIATGSADPDTEIKKYNDALYAAGLQDIIDAKQKQLDEWLAASGK